MKKILCVCILLTSLIVSVPATAENKHSLGNGVSLVQYGKTWILEDDNRQMSISVEIAQAGIDRKNDEMMYNVICNGSTKKVAKWTLKRAIAEGVKAAAASSGSSLLVSASALAVDIIYDEACDYWKEKSNY